MDVGLKLERTLESWEWVMHSQFTRVCLPQFSGLHLMDDPSGAPIKPDLKIFDVNGEGVLYSMHLTMHYCQREGIGGV
jgi:hypothetical protein